MIALCPKERSKQVEQAMAEQFAKTWHILRILHYESGPRSANYLSEEYLEGME